MSGQGGNGVLPIGQTLVPAQLATITILLSNGLLARLITAKHGVN